MTSRMGVAGRALGNRERCQLQTLLCSARHVWLLTTSPGSCSDLSGIGLCQQWCSGDALS